MQYIYFGGAFVSRLGENSAEPPASYEMGLWFCETNHA